MNDENIDQIGTLFELLESQIDILLAMFLRPVVQQQVLAIFVILFIAWIVPERFRRWWQKRNNTTHLATENLSQNQRRLANVYHLLTPIFALLLLTLTIWLFAKQNMPNGLLENMTTIIWFWLIYRTALTFLYVRFGDGLRPYHNWIITPIFLFFVVLQVFRMLPGSVTLIEATIRLGTITSTFGDLMFAAIIMYSFVVGAWVVKQLMMQYLPQQLNAEPGVVESIATLTRYALLSLGVIVSLSMLGLNFTSLAIVAGGLSVGIGIGLQDIVSNFVSGIVLLFEQSLRPGDIVELDGRISQVEKISLRATIVRTRTNEELIIPNSNFTTQQVKNLTKSDRRVQIQVPLGVSYKSDPKQIKQLAVETTLKHPKVLSMPIPYVYFIGYGDSSLNFVLHASINHPELTVSIRSDLYFMLWEVFADHNIEIPFPQRDLNLGEGWEKLTPELQAQQDQIISQNQELD